MHVRGSIQLTLDIQELQMFVNFYVVPYLQFDVILGVDFFQTNQGQDRYAATNCHAL